MAKRNQIFKCGVCGNVISVIEAGKGELVCCGQPMELLEEKTAADEGKEKHVPVVEKTGSSVTVKVGSTLHPMEENHYIELVQIIQNGEIAAGKRLRPGDSPTAEFCFADAENLTARALCNVHGLWKNNS
ncbi:MAG: desulfoferrodoxin [bacterium]